MAANPVINIVIPQGSDFEETFSSTESDGSASNLAGFTGEAKIKKHPGSTSSTSFTVNITGATGAVSIAMTSGVLEVSVQVDTYMMLDLLLLLVQNLDW